MQRGDVRAEEQRLGAKATGLDDLRDHRGQHAELGQDEKDDPPLMHAAI